MLDKVGRTASVLLLSFGIYEIIMWFFYSNFSLMLGIVAIIVGLMGGVVFDEN